MKESRRLVLNTADGSDPCGGGFEYLHRDPASRRRRRKGKSQIWESKIWPRVPRDWDPRKTTLARANSIYKDRPVLSSESAPHKNKTVTVNKTYWLTDRQSQCDFDFDLTQLVVLLLTEEFKHWVNLIQFMSVKYKSSCTHPPQQNTHQYKTGRTPLTVTNATASRTTAS
jgi:hypothetical protein